MFNKSNEIEEYPAEPLMLNDKINNIQDISVRMFYIDTLYNLNSGLVLISYCYGIYYTSVLEMITSINGFDKEKDEHFRRKLGVLYRSFFRELEDKKNNDNDQYDIFKRYYRVSSNDGQTYTLLSIRDIENGFSDLSNALVSCINDPDINQWPTKHFGNITDKIYNIYNQIAAFTEDIESVYLKPNSISAIKKPKLKIKTTTDLYNAIQDILKTLNTLHESIVDLLSDIAGLIDLAHPLGDVDSLVGLKNTINEANEDLKTPPEEEDF